MGNEAQSKIYLTWEPNLFPSAPKLHTKNLLPSPTPNQKTQKTTQTKNTTQNTNKKVGCAHKKYFNNNQRKEKTRLQGKSRS